VITHIAVFAISSPIFSIFTLFSLLLPRPPTSTLFPYTTLFRSAPPRRVQLGLYLPRMANLPRPLTYRFSARGTGSRAGSLFDNQDRKSTRLNSSHVAISYAVFCLKKKKRMLSG